MENKVCKNKNCMKTLPDGYKYKFCEACRNQQVQKVKKGLKTVVSVAGSAVCFAIVTIGKNNSKKL